MRPYGRQIKRPGAYAAMRRMEPQHPLAIFATSSKLPKKAPPILHTPHAEQNCMAVSRRKDIDPRKSHVITLNKKGHILPACEEGHEHYGGCVALLRENDIEDIGPRMKTYLIEQKIVTKHQI